MSTPVNRNKEAQKVTIIGAILDTLLGFAKIIIGVASNSNALIADGIHSFSDLLTDFMVVIIFHFSHDEPDEEHPWGHARFETIGTVFLGCVLIAVAGAMAFESIREFWTSTTVPTPGWAALLVAFLSIVSKEWIYRYTLAAGKRLKSDLLIANAWHSRTDALSSVVVLFGIAGAMAGFAWMDILAAIVVAVFVGKIGWDLTWNSIKELVDTALPEERVTELKEVVEEVDGIINVHHFKSRNMGSKSLLEMHIQVAPYCSASEGHWIGDTAVIKLLQRFDDIGHVIFHIDTYDDEEESYCRILPVRKEIEAMLKEHLAAHDQVLENFHVTLHYLHDLIEIELKLVPITKESQKEMPLSVLSTQLNNAMQPQPWFSKLTIWTH
ncbi:cation diffusion facilitator family transporter [Neptunomonas antarctica]|uniref:Cation diffusion facilitator family transporter n=1 Tax=Neptunomonas antarctica TaxID=619304 RepID=A0A1N7KLB8_9GAMM|nr:cation diffusion facilitator family transporter [Neptunomonas antarctica]SIS62402.1 cation diffusion facilitator family transporter [Neptunomonas antarctica]